MPRRAIFQHLMFPGFNTCNLAARRERVYPDGMPTLIKPILPKASLPSIPMGCLTMLFLFPAQILFLPITLLARWRTNA